MQHEPAKNSAQRLLSTPEGRQLAALLARADPAAMHSALEAAKQGNGAAAQALLQPLLSDPQIQTLLQRLEGSV